MFISDLLEQCGKSKKDITVVYITSSITISETMSEEEFYSWKYVAVRHMQQVHGLLDRKRLKVLAISPNLTDPTTRLCLKNSKCLYNPRIEKSILDLSEQMNGDPLYK